MAMSEQHLFDLKNEIEEAKTELAGLDGQKKQLLRDLKETFKCTTIEDAQTLLDKMETDVERIQTQIQEGFTELKEKYNDLL